jgi:hypothetical protein
MEWDGWEWFGACGVLRHRTDGYRERTLFSQMRIPLGRRARRSPAWRRLLLSDRYWRTEGDLEGTWIQM